MVEAVRAIWFSFETLALRYGRTLRIVVLILPRNPAQISVNKTELKI
jgi:hypothetical protein